MKLLLFILFLFTIQNLDLSAQNDSLSTNNDSLNTAALEEYNQKLNEIEKLRYADSVKKAELENQLNKLKTTDNLEKTELLKQLKDIEENEKQRILTKRAKIDSLRNIAKGFPVIGSMHDTLFYIYTKIGASTSKDRALNITEKIDVLYEDDYFNKDSLLIDNSESTIDIVYGETIIMSISESDAIWYSGSLDETAKKFKEKILNSVETGKKENTIIKIIPHLPVFFSRKKS